MILQINRKPKCFADQRLFLSNSFYVFAMMMQYYQILICLIILVYCNDFVDSWINRVRNAFRITYIATSSRSSSNLPKSESVDWRRRNNSKRPTSPYHTDIEHSSPRYQKSNITSKSNSADNPFVKVLWSGDKTEQSSSSSSSSSKEYRNSRNNYKGYNGKSESSKLRRKVRRVKSFADLSTQPDNFYRTLCYNHLATNSLKGVEAMPHFRFDKGDSYLTKWWYMCKKWNLLTGEFKQLDEELEAKWIENNVINNDIDGINDVSNSDSDSIGDNNSLIENHDNLLIDDENDQEEENESEEESIVIDNNNSHIQNHDHNKKPLHKQSPPAPLEILRASCENVQPRIICIGDVHGCVDEVCDLLVKLEYRPGDLILFLGDLVAKGPYSAQVVRLAMDLGALSVRGNHDHEVVRQGVTYRNKKGKYKSYTARSNAIETHEHLRVALELSVRELNWLAQLPYYICSVDLGSLFVHAGFQSSVKLGDQDPWVMMTMRSLLADGRVSARCIYTQPWANHWNGPLTVLFGHDAARGLQHHDHAVGLDTGCVYGGELSALVLPEKNIVSVPARKVYANYVNSRSHKAYISSKKGVIEEIKENSTPSPSNTATVTASVETEKSNNA